MQREKHFEIVGCGCSGCAGVFDMIFKVFTAHVSKGNFCYFV